MKTIAVLLIKKDNLEPMIIKRNVKIHIKIRFNLSCETCSKYVVGFDLLGTKSHIIRKSFTNIYIVHSNTWNNTTDLMMLPVVL